ncbi:caspase family protein [Myxococcota bacterium]|nr:caspase family protein [Myxococcota bacterium]
MTRRSAASGLVALVAIASSAPGLAVAAPEVVIQRGLRFGAQHFALSADGSRVAASGGWDRHVLVFETATGRQVRRLPFDAEVRGVALEDDGRALWAAVGDQLVRVDLARGERSSSGSVFGALGDLARRPDGAVIAAVRGDRVHLFDGRTAKRMRELLLPPAIDAKLSRRFGAVAWSADGAWLATSTLRDGARPAWVGVWRADAYALTAHVVVEQGDANGVSALTGGGAVFGTSTGEVRRWRGGDAPAEVVGRHETPVSAICADATGREIVSGAGRWTGREYVDSDLHHWRPDGGGDVRRYSVAGIPPDDCVFSADGARVLAGTGLYVTASGRRVRELGLDGELAAYGVDFDAPRGAMVVSAYRRTMAWDLAEARQRYQVESCERSRVYPAIDRLVVKVCRDGGYSNVVAIHRLSDGRLVQEVTVDRERRNTLHFDLSSDGTRLATVTHGFGLRLFDAATGRVVKETPLDTNPRVGPRALTFTADGATLAVAAADTSVTLYAAKDGAERKRHATVLPGTTTMISTPDGKKLVLAGNTAATLDLTSGRVDFLPVRGIVESLAWSSDGRTLALGAGANGGTVQLYTLATGKLSAPHLVHANSSVLGVAFHPNGRLVMTAAFSGEVSLFSLDGMKRIADIAFLGDDGYAVYTPDRYYSATPRAHRHIHFVDGDRVIPFESFDLTFNRPDIVLERIGLADPAVLRLYRAAWERRVRRAGFAPEKLGRTTEVPHVELVGAAPPFEVATPSVQLALRARDPRRALSRLHVRVNGVDLAGSGGAPVTASAGASFERTVTVPLTPGRNVIRASVVNDEGVESPAVRVDVDFTGTAEPTLHVVSVGVSDYLGDAWDLSYAAKDARDLTAHFGRPGAPYGRVVAHTLLDGDVTRERLLATKEALKATRVEDRVVLFVAGHGLLDEQLRYWYATADVDFAAPSARGLDYDLLEGLLDGIPARHKLLLIDTCHAGEVDSEATLAVASGPGAPGKVRERAVRGLRKQGAPKAQGGRTSFQLLGEVFADLQRRSGAVVIASAAGTELALESAEWKNGVFTFAVLEALRASPHLPMSELHGRVSARVVELTAGRQRPAARQQNLDLDFSL